MYNIDLRQGIRLSIGLPFYVLSSALGDASGRVMPLTRVTKNWWDAIFVHFGLMEKAEIMFRNGTAYQLNGKNFVEFLLKVDRADSALKGKRLAGIDLKLLEKIKMDKLAENAITLEFRVHGHPCMNARGRDVVDIGAYVGDSSLLYALKCRSRHVYAIEPCKYYYSMGRRMVDKSHLSSLITFYNWAVGAEDGYVYMADDNSDFVISRVREGAHTKRVRCVSLDSLAKILKLNDAMLKIDVEGSEYDIVRSASIDTLKRFSAIHVEYHYGYVDIAEKLRKAGFRVKCTRPLYRFRGFSQPAMVMGDLFASRP